MIQLSHQQNQTHCEPEVCSDDSEYLVSKKRARPRFSTFAQVLVLFSLISFAHTAMSVPWSDLLKWTNKVIDETVAAVLDGESLSYSDIKQMVDNHFPSGNYSISSDEIRRLKLHFYRELSARLANTGVDIQQLADWFEMALDRFTGN